MTTRVEATTDIVLCIIENNLIDSLDQLSINTGSIRSIYCPEQVQ